MLAPFQQWDRIDQVESGPVTHDINTNLQSVYEHERVEVRLGINDAQRGPATRTQVSREFQRRNAQLVRTFADADVSTPPTFSTLDRAAIEDIYASAAKHPVVGFSALEKYDSVGYTGFCFGRATYAHIELLRQGAHPRAIVKLYALGPFHYAGSFWKFHVATAVRSRDAGWLVIDLLAGRLRSISEWGAMVEGMDAAGGNPLIRVYSTHPRKSFPQHGAYSWDLFNKPIFNGYFTDLVRSFEN